MDIIVCDRVDAIRMTRHPPTDRHMAMISITTPSMHYPSPVRPGGDVKTVLPVAFEDVESGPGVISDETADKIARFVKHQITRGADALVIHCDAGISRSAGVATAVAQHFGVRSVDFGEPPEPNPAVHAAVFLALQRIKTHDII